MATLKELTQFALDYNNRFEEQWGAKCGLTVVDAIPGDEPKFIFEYRATDEHKNIFHGVHGGMIGFIFDTAMGVAGDAASDKDTSTTEMTISYVRAMMGDHYYVTVEINKIGRTLLSCTSYISDEKGLKYATCQARYVLLERGYK